MCTVSYVNSNGCVIITSNRDEKVIRPSASAPQNYLVNGKNVIFPKDPKAGGTWFAIDSVGTVLVLLNGAVKKHQTELNYRKSRGLIVLELIGQHNPVNYWSCIDLENIEPFTMVLYHKKRLFHLWWNGKIKESVALNPSKNYLWSSVTLYPEEIRAERSKWFVSFLEGKQEISSAEMLQFHRDTQEENKENGLVINRHDALKTLSITQTIIEQNRSIMTYLDLIENKDFSTSFITI